MKKAFMDSDWISSIFYLSTEDLRFTNAILVFKKNNNLCKFGCNNTNNNRNVFQLDYRVIREMYEHTKS